jgi:hypothetical protein
VRAYFEATDPTGYNYKATWGYWIKVTIFFALWLLAIRSALLATSTGLKYSL